MSELISTHLIFYEIAINTDQLLFIAVGMTEKHMHQEEYPLTHYRKLRKIVRRKKADIEENNENSFNIDSIGEISQQEIIQTDSEEDDTETDGFFLQPVPTRQRRSLLKIAGIKKVDMSEREECKELRGSREQCGCDCQGECVPETCLCAQNGIQCQVDRYSFPCGCTKQGCQNPSGRIEFNPTKVAKHLHHTLGRLKKEAELEAKSGKAAVDFNVARNKHIHFEDEDLGEEREPYNSTLAGTCADCHSTSLFFASNTAPSANNAPLSFDADNQPSTVLEPIAELLKPIDATHGDRTDDNATWLSNDWPPTSHESMLTCNNLLPVDSDLSSCSDDHLVVTPIVSASHSILSHFQLPSHLHESAATSACNKASCMPSIVVPDTHELAFPPLHADSTGVQS